MFLENLKWDHVEVNAGGSVYPTKGGKLGFAFYYRTEGEKIERVSFPGAECVRAARWCRASSR